MLGDHRQAPVKTDEAAVLLDGALLVAGQHLGRVLGEPGAQLAGGGRVGGVELLPNLQLLGGHRRVEQLGGPGEGGPELAPFAVTGGLGGRGTRQELDHILVAEPLPHGLQIAEHGIGAVHPRGRRVGLQLLDPLDVSAEEPLLHRLGVEHVHRHIRKRRSPSCSHPFFANTGSKSVLPRAAGA